MTVKQMAQEIKDFMSGKTDYDVVQGLHVSKIGRKFVTTFDMYSSKSEKVAIEDFYAEYVKKRQKTVDKIKARDYIIYIKKSGY